MEAQVANLKLRLEKAEKIPPLSRLIVHGNQPGQSPGSLSFGSTPRFGTFDDASSEFGTPRSGLSRGLEGATPSTQREEDFAPYCNHPEKFFEMEPLAVTDRRRVWKCAQCDSTALLRPRSCYYCRHCRENRDVAVRICKSCWVTGRARFSLFRTATSVPTAGDDKEAGDAKLEHLTKLLKEREERKKNPHLRPRRAAAGEGEEEDDGEGYSPSSASARPAPQEPDSPPVVPAGPPVKLIRLRPSRKKGRSAPRPADREAQKVLLHTVHMRMEGAGGGLVAVPKDMLGPVTLPSGRP